MKLASWACSTSPCGLFLPTAGLQRRDKVFKPTRSTLLSCQQQLANDTAIRMGDFVPSQASAPWHWRSQPSTGAAQSPPQPLPLELWVGDAQQGWDRALHLSWGRVWRCPIARITGDVPRALQSRKSKGGYYSILFIIFILRRSILFYFRHSCTIFPPLPCCARSPQIHGEVGTSGGHITSLSPSPLPWAGRRNGNQGWNDQSDHPNQP